MNRLSRLILFLPMFLSACNLDGAGQVAIDHVEEMPGPVHVDADYWQAIENLSLSRALELASDGQGTLFAKSLQSAVDGEWEKVVRQASKDEGYRR